MKHKGKITISRPNYSDGSELIAIRLKDVDAGVILAEVEMTYSDFTKALTGLGGTPMEFTFYNANLIGKKILRDTISFKMPEHDYSNRKEIACEAVDKLMTDGWEADHYFGSQNSFFLQDDERWAKTSISKWIDK